MDSVLRDFQDSGPWHLRMLGFWRRRDMKIPHQRFQGVGSTEKVDKEGPGREARSG